MLSPLSVAPTCHNMGEDTRLIQLQETAGHRSLASPPWGFSHSLPPQLLLSDSLFIYVIKG